MIIRPATPEDIPLLRSLAEQTWRVCYDGILSPGQMDYMIPWMYGETEIAAQLARGVPWEIVEINGVAAGFTSHELGEDGRVKLHKLYVLPEHQGRGAGKALLAHVFERASVLGASGVWLQVNKGNARAIATYRRVGFAVEREAVFEIGGGFVMDDYLMFRPQ